MATHPFPAAAAQKRFIALRYWLLGHNYNEALRALDYNRRLFTGTRKDGVTPEFDHHVCQVQFLRTLLPYLDYPQETICTTLSHDTPEDKDVSPQEIERFYVDSQFGARVSLATMKVTKTYRGEKFNSVELFSQMSQCPIASIVKGVDRFHNLQSMVGVFSLEKQKEYVRETEEFILPMLKDAEFRFPSQEPAYKNIRTILKSQLAILSELQKYMEMDKENGA